MQRRAFLGAAAGAPWLTMTGGEAARADEHEGEGQRQCYELRRYRLGSEEDRRIVEGYLREAAIPAYNRLGVEPVGVFEPVADSEDAGKLLYVLLPFGSLPDVAAVREKLPADEAYQEAAKPYLSTPQDDPAYERIESSLMVAFSGFPRLRVPPQTERGDDRLFELRIYESHNERKARLKVEMFNEGEIELFNSLGFNTVFYGDTVVGDRLPNLTYMLVYDSREQRDKQWERFFESPGWEKLKNMERYQDTVSQVHNRFLKPTASSQL